MAMKVLKLCCERKTNWRTDLDTVNINMQAHQCVEFSVPINLVVVIVQVDMQSGVEMMTVVID